MLVYEFVSVVAGSLWLCAAGGTSNREVSGKPWGGTGGGTRPCLIILSLFCGEHDLLTFPTCRINAKNGNLGRSFLSHQQVSGFIQTLKSLYPQGGVYLPEADGARWHY